MSSNLESANPNPISSVLKPSMPVSVGLPAAAPPAHVPVTMSYCRIALKRVIKTLFGIVSLPLLFRRPTGVRVLYYHRVNPYAFKNLGPVSREITITPAAFEAQLRWLRKHDYRSVHPRQFEQMLAGDQAADPKTVLITFDDGFEDNFLWAHPLLLKYGFQGVYFITTQFIGADQGPEWTVGDMPGCGRFMRWQQILQMHADGALIASHTCSHPMLPQTDDMQLAQELVASHEQLSARIDDLVRWIAYPAGHHDVRVCDATSAAGYKVGFTTVTGAACCNSDPMRVPRSAISASESLFIFRMHMAGALDWMRFKERPGFRRVMERINRFLIRRLVAK